MTRVIRENNFLSMENVCGMMHFFVTSHAYLLSYMVFFFTIFIFICILSDDAGVICTAKSLTVP